jgi:hypothetical protein
MTGMIRRRALAAGLIAMSLTVAACGDGDNGTAAADETPRTSLAPKPASSARAPSPSYDTLELPKSVTYGGIEWTVESVEFVPARSDEDDDGDPAMVAVGFSARNTLEGTRVTYPAELLGLSGADGVVTRADRLEGTESEYRVDIESESEVTGTAVFEVDTPPDADDLRFVIDEGDKVPGELELAGENVPDTQLEPVWFGDPGPSPSLYFATQLFDLYGTIEPLDASWSLDWGVERADLDTHFLLVTVRISAAPDNGVSLSVRDDDYRLVVDGVAREVVGVGGDETDPVAGTSVDRVLVFSVPDAASSLTLSVGQDGADDARWELG